MTHHIFLNRAACPAAGIRVLLIDIDPQGSAPDFAAAQERSIVPRHRVAPPDHSQRGGALVEWLRPCRRRWTATSERAGKVSHHASDVVIIPVHPSPYDVSAAGEVVRGIGEPMLYMPTPSSCFVFNRKIGVGSQMLKSSAKSVMEQTSGLDFFSLWLRPLRPLRWRSATSAFPPGQDRRGQWSAPPSVSLG